MPKGKPKRGGIRAAAHGDAGPVKKANYRVAKPTAIEIPKELLISPANESVPQVIIDSLTEFHKIQPFFSALEKMYPEFGVNSDNYKKCWMGITNIKSLDHDASDSGHYGKLMLDDDSIRKVFIKRVHLLDAINAMEGEYVWPDDGGLPSPSEPWKTALAKINDPLNEAYVDAIFALTANKLVESKLSPHWCRCFGTFTARVDKYFYNISEEYPSMRKKAWYRRNMQRGIFEVVDPMDTDGSSDGGSEKGFVTEGGVELELDDFTSVVETADGAKSADVESIKEEDPEFQTESSSIQLSAPKLRLERIKSPESSMGSTDDTDDDDDTDDEDLEEKYAVFNNFPVQVTLLEEEEGTMDDLLEDEDVNDTVWTAYLFQVIAALSCAQHWFGFVHNDLHSNNIMWSNTTDSYLYYRIHKGKDVYYMRVPTYGKLMKIIDFGRATYHLPEPAGFFISDAFYPGNDAGDQYNCEPFYDSDDGPKLEPNPSFDLCRLSISLIESLYPERPTAASPIRILNKEGAKMYTATVSELYNMLWEWLIDDNGKNVLRRPDGKERYPDFDLYKAIAKDVHSAVPVKQIEREIFSSYKCVKDEIPIGAAVYDLWISV